MESVPQGSDRRRLFLDWRWVNSVIAILMCAVLRVGIAHGSAPPPQERANLARVSARPVDSLGIYAWPISVQQGDIVALYVSTTGSTFDLSIRREGVTSVEVARYAGFPAVVQPVSDSAFAKGCNWSPALLLHIPETWSSGVYTARCVGPDTGFSAIFVVRERHPASTARILFELPVTTWQAYNNWGGHSLYPYNSTDGVQSTFVSLRRPVSYNEGLSFFVWREARLITFLESRGYSIEYCMGTDLQRLPDLERHYDLLIGCGHDEYWSAEMRGTVEARIARGGSVAFFTGDLCGWQIRLEGDDRIVCYKDRNLDPLNGIDNSRVTVQWWDTPVNRPENSMTGVGYRNGGVVNWLGTLPESLGYGGYSAYHTDHWIFDGTGLRDGSYFGAHPPIVGYETDGALFQWVNGEPVVTGADGTPLTFIPLGISLASLGHATMGIFSGPGLVFNAATTDWVFGLPSDATVQRITLNVVNGLLHGAPLSPPRARPPNAAPTVSVSPDPTRGSLTIEWLAPVWRGEARVSIYDLAGRVVAHPEASDMPGGGHARWDGIGPDGRSVAPGIYLGRVDCGRHTIPIRFLVLR